MRRPTSPTCCPALWRRCTPASAAAPLPPAWSSSATRGSSTARTATPARGSPPAEETRLNQTADLLNSRLAIQAAAAGFGFANPTTRFVGHAACDDVEWINGLSWPIVESYHPNRAGQASGHTPTVSPLLVGAAVRATPAVLEAAARQAPALARQQRRFAAVDASIRPADFVKPDLTTEDARVAAALRFA